MLDQAIIDRFWRGTEAGSACWLWKDGLSDSGYGRFKVARRWYSAHRVSYQIHRGAIPSGLLVCHKCDVPRCANPSHLFLGTIADNNADRAAKNGGSYNRGSSNGRAKLTAEDVLRVRALSSSGNTVRSLAKQFRVARCTIKDLRAGRTWKWLTSGEVA